ncbi:GNAT family N-acetyltransferase [Dehalogenimonas sp. 4OHTPN]|uniref:GNAT family N-acetyltransferase n=1 Tax=Dehalogenimonas sp. 4OHTPN TaxID=3166643 RepID=A0AAU8G7Q8_9CHLR
MIVYRDIVPGDLPALESMLRRISEFAPDELPVANEVLEGSVSNPAGSGYYTVVAEVDGRPVGYATYGSTPLSRGNWEIYWAAVDPETQGRGIGRELMRRCETAVKQRGGWQITLETSSTPQYARTRRFHASCGYTEIARIPDFYDRGDDLVIFYKKLG